MFAFIIIAFVGFFLSIPVFKFLGWLINEIRNWFRQFDPTIKTEQTKEQLKIAIWNNLPERKKQEYFNKIENYKF